MKLADRISLQIMDQMKTGLDDILIPNYFVGKFEMDVFKLTNNGYVSEFEIKVSLTDFEADFRKKDKHQLLASKVYPANRFYFVSPSGLLSLNNIPKYAGWLEFEDNRLYTKKNAPLLNKERYSDYKKIAQKMAIRERNYRQKLRFNNL